MWRLLLAMGFFNAATSITDNYSQDPYFTTDYNNFANVTCPGEHFLCLGTEICLQRDLFCDGVKHCPQGDDENAHTCVDVTGSVMRMLYNQSLVPFETHASFLNCTLPIGSEVELLGCFCRNLSHQGKVRSRLICDAITNLTRFPEVPDGYESVVFHRNDLKDIALANPSSIELWKVLSLNENKIEVIRKGVMRNLISLINLFLNGNQIHTIEQGAFQNLNQLDWLSMDKNRLKHFNFQNLKDTPALQHLSIAYNQLSFDKGERIYLPNALTWLGLDGNRIERIDADLFVEGSKNLVFLNLSYNQIEEVDENAFRNFPQLEDLSLDHNRIAFLKPKTFFWFRNLSKLYLGYNFFTTLPFDIFSQISVLQSLDLSDIELVNINSRHFSNLRIANFFVFKKFRYCSYAPHVKVCSPRMDGLSSTEHLLVWPILRLSVWVVALVTIFSNSVVFSWRILSRKEDRVLSLFVKNLSVADFLMGIYLLAVAVHDVIYRQVYNRYAMSWMTSWRCMVCGMMAMLSCEVSVLILSLITFERYRCIRTNVRVVTEKAAKYALLAVWMTGLLLALLPLSQIDGLNSFYASNGLCFPLHIHDPYMVGWQYSAFVFLGINFLAVVLIISLYLWMFVKIKHDRRRARPVLLKQREDAVLARRFFFIVLTDCLCWIPIIIIKILALSGISINDNLYAFIVVFILPVNSALNPVIYTLAAPTELRRRIRQMVPGKWFCKTRHSFASTDSKTANSSLATQSSSLSDGRSNSNGTVIIPATASSRPGTILESSNEESDVGDETKL